MVASPRAKELAQRKRRGAKGTTKPFTLPATMGGINASVPMLMIPPEDCVYCFNLFPSRYGLRSRPGYSRWCPAVPAGSGIRTLIPCNGTDVSESNKRLFAVTSDGIYDVTISGGTPIKKYDFAVKTGRAGYCSWRSYMVLAGQVILICDEENGYIIYTVSTDTFAAGSISVKAPGAPASAADMAFVTVWKNRVWLVRRNSARAYYVLEPDTYQGEIAQFDFGSRFKYGGYLKGIWNWTADGGAGIDDHFVAISSQGDVAVFTGYDPENVQTFQMKGMWYLGRTPEGRRFVIEEGGDLLILTSQGVLSLSQLTSGLSVRDDQAFYLTKKINSLLRQVFEQRETFLGYEINTMPKFSGIIMPQPRRLGERYIQWAYSYETKGWFVLRDMPINTVENWGNRVFFGDTSNNVWEITGVVDAVNPADALSGTPVEFSTLSSYQSFGAPAVLKRVHMLRPYWVGQAIPQYAVEARYDFQIEESGVAPGFFRPSGSLWDLSNWDNAIWGGGYLMQHTPYGATGMGYYVAVAIRGNSVGDSALMGCDILYDTGGMM